MVDGGCNWRNRSELLGGLMRCPQERDIRPMPAFMSTRDDVPRPDAVKQTPTVGIQFPEPISLQPISQNMKQQMAGQVRGRSPPERRVPSGSQFPFTETAQPRDLVVERLSLRHRGPSERGERIGGIARARAAGAFKPYRHLGRKGRGGRSGL